jgi:Cof subfamily protein (haloacid dehalogenase superfamily)
MGDAPRIRLVAVDLDGTLLNRGNRVSDANAAAVREAVAAGIHIVIATSRWHALAKRTADALGIIAPIICHNGAHIRTADGGYLLRLDLPPDAAREIAAISDEQRYEAMFTVGDVTYMITKRPDIDPARLPGGMRLTDALTPHVRDGANAFLCFGQDACDGIRERLGRRYDGAINIAYGVSATFPPYLNIVHAAADKGRALEIVCDHLGVPLAETMAIGDAAPDLDMMRRAGVSIAMGNAPDDVRREATATGPSNTDDGVAWALREWALPR